MVDKIKIEKENIGGWEGYRLSNNGISLGVAPQIGGRIVSLMCHDIELLFVQEKHKGKIYDFQGVDDLFDEKRKMGFNLWGGDKTWVAPQNLWLEKIPPL